MSKEIENKIICYFFFFMFCSLVIFKGFLSSARFLDDESIVTGSFLNIALIGIL